MEPITIIMTCVLFAVAVAVGIVMIIRKDKAVKSASDETHGVTAERNKAEIVDMESTELSIKFEGIPALTEEEETHLVEVTDKKLIAKIDGVIPGTLLAMANAGAIHNYQEAAQSAGQLYQAVIPKGAVLSNSKAMEGAVRGFYHQWHL